jgi:threonine/homoserine/homoserine lactone efflux protein
MSRMQTAVGEAPLPDARGAIASAATRPRFLLREGLTFGLLVQLAIGPVSVFVLDVAVADGFYQAELGVLAATTIDALYFLLACFGVARFLARPSAQRIFRTFAAVVLASFGASIVFKALGLPLLPRLVSIGGGRHQGAFVLGLIITASNPLTILFWAGVFSAKAATAAYRRKELALFGAGAVLATLVFKTTIALCGATAKQVLPARFIILMNLLVGLSLLGFALRLVFSPRRLEPR